MWNERMIGASSGSYGRMKSADDGGNRAAPEESSAMDVSIILIQPPLPANERHKRVLPLGLAYLAAYTRTRIPDLRYRIIDGQVLGLSIEEIVRRVAAEPGGRKIVGVTYWTCQAPAARGISAEIKKRIPGSVIIHGGIHTTIFPEEALTHADYAILNEGEQTFYELLRHLLNGEGELSAIPGIAYRSDTGSRVTAPRQFIQDLDDIPFPAWDLLDIERYDSPLHIVGGKRLPIIGSRGCPYGCTYCGSPLMWRKQVRWRSPENVVGEIKASIEQLGIAQFHFWDDNLMLKRAYIEKLCRLIMAEGLKIKWTGLTRASHIARNGDLMGLMKEAGCIGLEVGIESANPKTFYTIQKEESLQTIEEVARLHKENGMYPLYTYMAFNPGESISGYYEQARFIDRLTADLPWYDYFHPLPFPLYTGQFCTPHVGTKLHDEAPQLGTVLADGLEDYYHHRINFAPNTLLDDLPCRNAARLTLFHYRLCTFALTWSFWSDFNAAVPLERQRAELADYRDCLALFWKLSNGKRALRAIAEETHRKLAIDRKQAIRFCAFIALVLGQTGVIVSARDDKNKVRKEIKVATMEQISNNLKPFGAEMPLPFLKRGMYRLKRLLTGDRNVNERNSR
jgi:radical SAM superfamily enzyme YgiQ (UPF0313 family)